MISELDKKDYESLWGSSFHGTTIETSAEMLTRALGFEPQGPSGDGKTSREWRVETEYGSFAIYDWKYGTFKDNESITWHIGGKSRDKEEQFRDELIDLLASV